MSPTDRKMPEASEAGQMPPTDAHPVRQHYQLACHEGGGSGGAEGYSSKPEGQVSRRPTKSRQFNRGSGGGGGGNRSRKGY